MELIKPCKKYEEQYIDYIKEVVKNEETNKVGEVFQKDNETFDDMLVRVEQLSNEKNLIGMMKPTTCFWMLENEEIVGSINLRHELNEFTYYTIGNIDYYVRPSRRNKGYAKKALSLTKDFYRSLDVKKY